MNDRQQERDEMVQAQLVPRGIKEPRVLDAFRRVPRHEFIPLNFRARSLRRQRPADRRRANHLPTLYGRDHDGIAAFAGGMKRSWRSAPAPATRRRSWRRWPKKLSRSSGCQPWRTGQKYFDPPRRDPMWNSLWATAAPAIPPAPLMTRSSSPPAVRIFRRR